MDKHNLSIMKSFYVLQAKSECGIQEKKMSFDTYSYHNIGILWTLWTKDK